MSKVLIECTRVTAVAQSRLEAFVPEPPFGQAAAKELHAQQTALEHRRAALEEAERQHSAHVKTHLLTISR